MVALTWLGGLLAHRRTRLVATALGVAVGVALLASIGWSATVAVRPEPNVRPAPAQTASGSAALMPPPARRAA